MENLVAGKEIARVLFVLMRGFEELVIGIGSCLFYLKYHCSPCKIGVYLKHNVGLNNGHVSCEETIEIRVIKLGSCHVEVHVMIILDK